MDEQKLITVAEYAALQGISKQRVYQLAGKSLKPYVVIVNGQKMINIQALEQVNKTLEQDLDTPKTPEKSTLAGEAETPIEQDLEQGLDTSLIELFRQQLEAKDKLIAELQQANAEKDRHIMEQSEKLAVLLNQSQQLQQNNQLLLAAQTQQQEQAAQAAEEQKKKGFFSRLFGR